MIPIQCAAYSASAAAQAHVRYARVYRRTHNDEGGKNYL